jgi:hypothetical protein
MNCSDNTFFLRIALFVWMLCSPTLRGDEPLGVAVLHSGGTEGYAALIEAALSQRPEIRVLERESLPAAVREVTLGPERINGESRTALGLLGADGIVLVDAGGPASISFRLVRVKTGVVISAFLPPGGEKLQPTADAAMVIVDRLFRTGLKSLGGEKKDDLPVSVLGIRAAGTRPTRKLMTFRSQLSSILGARLAVESGITVLERESLGDVEFETMFKDNESSSTYWAGAWLLEGTLSEDAEGPWRLEMRLTKPSGESEVRWEVPLTESANAPDVAGMVASRVAVETKIRGPETPGRPNWNLAVESDAFRREASWALSQGYFDQAIQAARAATVLGERRSHLALQLLIEAQAGSVGQLAFSRTGNQPSRYRETAAMAVECLGNLESLLALPGRNQIESFDTILQVSRASRSALYACWQAGDRIPDSALADLEDFREAFLKTGGVVDDAFSKLPLSVRLENSAFWQWKSEKAQSFGLWQPMGSDYVGAWIEEFERDPNFAPNPHVFSRDVLPARGGWRSNQDAGNIVADWRQLEQTLAVSDNPHLKMRGWIIRRKLRAYYDSLKLESGSPARHLTEPAWIGKPGMGEALEIVQSDFEAFAGNPDVGYYRYPLFNAIHEYSGSPEKEWTEAGGRAATDLIVAILKRTETPQPLVSQFGLSVAPMSTGVMDPKLTGMRWPISEWREIASAFRDYEQKMRANLRPQQLAGLFLVERTAIEKEGLLGNAPAREPNPLAVLTLTNPIRLGLPIPIQQPFNPVPFYGKYIEGNHFLAAYLKWGRAFGQGECVGIRLEKLEVATGKTESMDFPPPERLIDPHLYSMLSPRDLLPVKNGALMTGLIMRRIGESKTMTQMAYLIHLDELSRTSTYYELESTSIYPRTHVTREGIACIECQAPPDKGDTAASAVQGLGFENRVALYLYDSTGRQLSEIANSTRRPATNFLDDRSGYSPSYFGPGPGGSIVCTAWFPMQKGSNQFTPTNLVWNRKTRDWDQGDFDLLGREWNGSLLPQTGQMLIFSESGDLFWEEDGKTGTLVGHSKEARFSHSHRAQIGTAIAKVSSTRRTITQGSKAPLPNGGICFLLVRPDTSNSDRPLLRCYHPDFGRYHFDLEVDFADLPALYRAEPRSKGTTPSASTLSNPPAYRWEIAALPESLALISKHPVEAFIYHIPFSEIRNRLVALSEKRDTLTDYETPTRGLIPSISELRPGLLESGVLHAIESNDPVAIDASLKLGLSPDAPLGEHSLSPLCLAAYFGKPKAMEALLKAGWDPNLLSQNAPALVWAVRGRSVACLNMLLNAPGTRIDDQTSGLCLPLVWEALQSRDSSIIELVWEHMYPAGEFGKTLRVVAGLARDRGKLSVMLEAEAQLKKHAVSP